MTGEVCIRPHSPHARNISILRCVHVSYSFLYHLSPEEGHLLTENARDVTFYSSHLLHYTNPTRGVCAWLTLSPSASESYAETTRSRTNVGVMSSESGRGAATFGGLSPDVDNSTPSLHHFLTQRGH